MVSKSLFEKQVDYLYIFYNNQRFGGSIEKLMESYEEFYAVSYVSSYSFILKIISKFKKAVLILGEEESISDFLSLNVEREEKLIRAIAEREEYKNRLEDGSLEIRYIVGNKKLHSKLYILKNEEKTLAMRGSANLTETAFSNSFQFEELVVYDSSYNPEFVQDCWERFKFLYSISSELPETVLNKAKNIQSIKNSVLICQNSEVNIQSIEGSIIIADENTTIYTEEEKAERIVEMVSSNGKIADAGNLLIRVKEEKNVCQKRLVELEQLEKVLELSTKRTKEGIVFKKPEELKKKNLLERIVEVIKTRKEEKTNPLGQRPVLLYSADQNVLYLKSGELLEPYCSPVEKSLLRAGLEKLNNYAESYRFFSQGGDHAVQRVYEAILFAFTSPFIWLFRTNISREKSEEKIAEIPIVMVLGGSANSGKTKLLNSINRLMGSMFPVFSYKDLYNRTQLWMAWAFENDNVFPVFVDELDQSFFKGVGERQIKHYSNTLTKPSPCIIGTSNISFPVDSQVVRRIYYLHFDSVFPEDKKLKAEAESYLEEKVGAFDDKIFRHFVYLFLKHIEEGSELYKVHDPLFLSRQIFMDMYRYAELEIPAHLPSEPYGDYYKKGSDEWRTFYKTKNNLFKEIKENGRLFYVIDVSYFDKKTKEEMQNKLPPSIVKPTTTPQIVVDKEKFLQFIGVKEGLIKRFLKR